MIRGFDEDDDKVLVRSDETLTYIAKDIPYALGNWVYFLTPSFITHFQSNGTLQSSGQIPLTNRSVLRQNEGLEVHRS